MSYRKLESTYAPKIGGTSPHDHYIEVLHSIAISLKRLADFAENNGIGTGVGDALKDALHIDRGAR